MNKNPERTAARRMAILCAARDLFMEKGFEGTSIRMIQERVGKQVAVFYYYFESKDQVFDEAVDLVLKDFRNLMEDTYRDHRESPVQDLERLLQVVWEEGKLARERFAGKLHWSVVGAVRSHIISMIKEDTRQILQDYQNAGQLPNLTMDVEEVSRILAYSFGGDILYEDKTGAGTYTKMLKLIPMLLGI